MPAARFGPRSVAASSAARSDRHIVDQPRPADPRGDEQACRAVAELIEEHQALDIRQVGIIDAGEATLD
jgi:hypothetical protein